MPLMGSLYIGTSGLQTGQNALNATAHNLTNVDTTGYTRQQVQLSDRTYVTLSKTESAVSYQQYGLGVSFSRIKQVRDFFLDQTFRRESGRSMFYEVSTEVLEEVESQLGELQGEAFQETMADLWTAIQELSKDPSSSVTQGLLVQRASEFIERANAVYTGFEAYQDNLNVQVRQQVDKINEYGEQILTLNDQIRKIECGGTERANDLRDARNQILDELAELTSINYSEDLYGNIAIQIEGVDFVKGGMCYEIGLQVDETTGFYTPFWPQNANYTTLPDGIREYVIDGAQVFDLTRGISSDLGTDIGGLKAMLLARGDHRADYSDIEDGSYDSISQSVIMNVQAEFDQLIHNVVSRINSALATAAGVTRGDLVLSDGTTRTDVRYCEVDEDGYMRNDDGTPIQLFNKITTDEYEIVKDGDKTYAIYVEEDLTQDDTLYTVKNIQINPELMQNPANLGFIMPDGSVDNSVAEELKAAFTEEIYTLNPNVKKKTTFNDYYSDLVAQVGNSGYVYRSIYENQQTTVEATESAREQVIGVSSDEELSNMIKFQNAYNAASRYINVVSEMLEHIINTLAI